MKTFREVFVRIWVEEGVEGEERRERRPRITIGKVVKNTV